MLWRVGCASARMNRCPVFGHRRAAMRWTRVAGCGVVPRECARKPGTQMADSTPAQVQGGNPADGVAYEGATVLDAKQARGRLATLVGLLHGPAV